MPAQPNSRWFILGAGAVGCLFANYLHRAGIDVTLLLRDEETLRQWQSVGGMTVESDAGLQQSMPRALVPQAMARDLGSNTPRIRQLLICTKAHQTQAAISSILPFLANDATVVLLQNGMGIREVLQSLRPDATFIHALTTEGVWRRDRFHLVHASRGETVLGGITAPSAQPDHASEQATSQRIVSEWQNTGLTIKAVADIELRLWHKLAVNCVINPLTALQRCRNGELLQLTDISERITQICAEVAAVAREQSVPLDLTALQENVLTVIRKTAHNRSSMLQDIEHHRPTEIDYLNGHVMRLAQRYDLPAEANTRLYQAIVQLSPPHD